MNIGLVIGKKNSVGLPGKNTRKILGRPSCEYSFIAAQHAKLDQVFVSTDCEVIANVGAKYNAHHIQRPLELATPDSLTEDVITHAYEYIKKILKADNNNISTISLLMSNTPTVNVNLLKEAISFLKKSNKYDSCFSVVRYDMFTPVRARKLSQEGDIIPFVDLDSFDNISSIRDSGGSAYFCDLSIQCMKPKCIEDMDNGHLPFKWQGNKSKAIETDFGFDVDTEWQVAVVEYWLKKHGFTDKIIPWE